MGPKIFDPTAKEKTCSNAQKESNPILSLFI